MYICICRKISDKTITQHIENGAVSRVHLTAATGAGSCCGQCIDVIDELLDAHLEKIEAQNNTGTFANAPVMFIPSSAA